MSEGNIQMTFLFFTPLQLPTPYHGIMFSYAFAAILNGTPRLGCRMWVHISMQKFQPVEMQIVKDRWGKLHEISSTPEIYQLAWR